MPIRRLLLVLLFAALAPTAAGGARVQVLASSADEPYASAARALEARLVAAQGLAVERVALDGWRSEPEVALVVALGTRAVQTALQAEPRRPVLAALLPREAWERALAGARDGPASALWLDQPAARQLRLARLVVPNAHKLGTLLGAATLAGRGELERSAAALGLDLRARVVTAAADPALALGALLDEVDAVLALPEPAAWNRVTAQPLLLATFRAGTPVIGFSAAYVRAGAVAAVHSTPTQVAEELAAVVAELDFDAAALRLPASRHPRLFEVATNRDVARALGIELADDATLAARLRATETPR